MIRWSTAEFIMMERNMIQSSLAHVHLLHPNVFRTQRLSNHLLPEAQPRCLTSTLRRRGMSSGAAREAPQLPYSVLVAGSRSIKSIRGLEHEDGGKWCGWQGKPFKRD
jgi:hypothetical protein